MPRVGERIAAGSAVALAVGPLVVLLVFSAQDVFYGLASLVAALLAISALWIAATNRRFRWWAAGASVFLVAGVVASLVASGRGRVAVGVVTVAIVAAPGLGSLVLRREVHRVVAEQWHPVPSTERGVVFMNPRSGDDTVTKLHLDDEARQRGIETVLLNRGDDLRALAEAAVARGADALGMAGGDGSQSVVAAVAAKHGLPFVCIPAGTRNHLALDLGIDRDDPVKALDAFGPARQTTIDLAEVNGEVFVNNVSLGVYAKIVASEEYRDAKRQTVADMLPDLLGPGAPPFELTVDSPDGPVVDAVLIQVSNNPYTLSSLAGFGSRPQLNTGTLGVATVSLGSRSDIGRLVALEVAGHSDRYQGWREWTVRELEVGGPPGMAAAVDGEARTWEPPLRFLIRPGALQVRIARGQPGASPALLEMPLGVSTVVGLVRIGCGRPSGLVSRRA